MATPGRPGDRELADELLLAGFATGDRQLAIALVRRFQAPVFGVALGVLADPEAAADVAHRCFERAWRHAEGYDALRDSVRGRGWWASHTTWPWTPPGPAPATPLRSTPPCSSLR